jgi:hypothetical protein
MGYTHNWKRALALDQTTWASAVADIAKLIAARPGLVAKEYDEPNEPPIVNGDMVLFNGIGDGGHETFIVLREEMQNPRFVEPIWEESFCKTNRKPYDELVVAVLCVFKKHFPDDFVVWSDGRWEYEWLHGAGFWGQENPSYDGYGKSGVGLIAEVLGPEYLHGVEVLRPREISQPG